MKIVKVWLTEEIKYVMTNSFHIELSGRVYFGKIVYKRNISSDYCMDETIRSNIDRMFCFRPESTYPSDVIDEINFDRHQGEISYGIG